MAKASRKPRGSFRDLHGILLLDKPLGLSSNQALQAARRLLRAAKGGHTGALDPLATGLLPLCFGESTKIAGLLLAERKAYETIAKFGEETDTCDSDGQVVATQRVPDLSTLHAVIPRFLGRIAQVPPIYSAIKRDGERLYELARRGEHVEIAARDVDVHAIEVLDTGDDFARLRIECGSGTYIRSLVRDLAHALGSGAHVAELRRLWVEPFRTPRMYTLDELEQARSDGRIETLLLPTEAGLAHFPRVDLDADQARRLAQGQTMFWHEARPDGTYAAWDASSRVLGLVHLRDGRLMPKRMFTWAAAA